MKTHLLLVNGKNQQHQAILPKELYTLNVVPLRISMVFFKAVEKTLFTFIWNNKPPQIAQTILGERMMGGIILPYLKLYYKAVVIKTA